MPAGVIASRRVLSGDALSGMYSFSIIRLYCKNPMGNWQTLIEYRMADSSCI